VYLNKFRIQIMIRFVSNIIERKKNMLINIINYQMT